MNNKRFAGLDGLRFISITFVVLHHLQTFKPNFGLDDLNFPVLGVMGSYGIQFFFMGSGFLITYLLLFELSQQQKINLKHFYLRRILRIWPGYYLLVFLMLLLYQQPFFHIPFVTDNYIAGNAVKSNLLYLFFMPHLAPFVNSTSPYVHQTYTIGIEEQFYLLWGLLFFFIPKKAHAIMWCIAFSVPVLNLLHQYLFHHLATQTAPSYTLSTIKKILYYIQYSKLSTFAIGSLFGYAFFNKQKWIYFLQNKAIQLLLYAVLLVSVLIPVALPFVQYEYMAVLMGLLMITATFKTKSLINYSLPWLEYLGKISYGIYLFHIFAIVFAVKLFQILPVAMPPLLAYVLLCTITMLLAILFGQISYHFFEKKFLLLKERFRKN